jgi:hypothetical protein
MKYNKKNKFQYQEKNDIKNYKMVIKMFGRLVVQLDFVCMSFVELSTAKFLKKNQGFII